MSAHRLLRAPRLFALSAGLLLTGAARASAQGWNAQLVLSPLPSPFLSDWEVDPAIGELIVTNSTGTTTDVTFHYTLTRNGQQLLRGVTDAQRIPSGPPVVFNATSTFGGRADWDRSMQDLVARTGRLPEGEYEGCVTLAGPGGVVLVARQCLRFSTQYPDPPFLVSPMNGDTVTSQDPIFQWQPVQISPLGDTRVGYVLQIAEVRTAAGQRPEVALETNIKHYLEPNLVETSHQYPVGARPLVSGRTYAWRVQALDGTGRPVASNQGRSEIWTFVYREPETEVLAKVASIVLEPRRDTLRYAGDTATFEARAYDADNVEIRGKKPQWRSLDTTVARVDSIGIVTGAGVGETRIVASVDGVADSAFSVMTPARLSVRFASYDPAADAPSLLELVKSGSFEEVVPKLMALLQSGEFVIPVPRLPGLAGGQARESGPGHERSDAGGPSGATTESYDAQRVQAADECSTTAVDNSKVSVSLSDSKKVFALLIPGITEFETCVQLPATEGEDPPTEVDTTFHRSAIFVFSMEHPGMPRVFLAIKGIGQLPLPLGGTEVHARYLVLNFLRTASIEASAVPEDYAAFFGTDSFDAGVGLTLFSKRRCARDATTPLCQVLETINPGSPDITVQAFAGITASESSVGTKGPGISTALGFSIAATLPVGRLNIEVARMSIDSLQVGLLFAVQDSMVNAPDTKPHNWSIGVAPTLTAWLTGSRGNSFEIDGSIGLEWDPTELGETLKPKLVVSAQLAQVWQLWWIRLGNPQLVFTTPVGAREERQATTLALSGTWGVGANEGIGVAEGGGDVRGDAGGAASGAATGFEELGRGQVTFEWKRRSIVKPSNEARLARDAAAKEFTRQLGVVRSAKQRLADAQAANGFEREGRVTPQATPSGGNGLLAPPVPTPPPAPGTLAAAQRELEIAQAELKRLYDAKVSARRAIMPTLEKCYDVRGRCLTWSASLSLGNGAIMDLLAMLVRFSTAP